MDTVIIWLPLETDNLILKEEEESNQSTVKVQAATDNTNNNKNQKLESTFLPSMYLIIRA